MDFSQIRGLANGQRYSFEELVCQLARRESVPSGSVFRRVEGSGGDGGVEGYWLLPNGSKHGYQAKYFTRARDVDWAQIDDSVSEAFKNHPSLTRYVVAIPCDLTDRSGATGKGRTGWEHWEAHKKKWLARKQGRSRIQFVAWTSSDLRDLLVLPSATGLRRYWFGTEEFSRDWFVRHVNAAVADLDERYHPENHVNVSIERLFSFVCRDEAAIKQLTETVAAIEKATVPDRYLKGIEDKVSLDDLLAISQSVADVGVIKNEFSLPSWQAWNLSRWRNLNGKLVHAIEKLRRWTWQERPRIDEKNTEKRNSFEYFSHALNVLDGKAESLQDLLNSRYLGAENLRAAIINGRAGTGKSHLLGSIAQKAAQEGRPTIFVLDTPKFSRGLRLNCAEAAQRVWNRRGHSRARFASVSFPASTAPARPTQSRRPE